MDVKKINEEEGEVVFFCPTGTPSSKNSRRWTGSRFLPSKATELWREETKDWWEGNKDKFLNELSGLEKPYLIGMHFVRKSKHKFDVINPMQSVQDEAVKYEYIDDDNADEMIPFPLSLDKKWYTYDKENPGVYIKIIKNKEDISNLHYKLGVKSKIKI